MDLREIVALTSTHLPNGIVTAEVARKQIDGTWLWGIDHRSISVRPHISTDCARPIGGSS